MNIRKMTAGVLACAVLFTGCNNGESSSAPKNSIKFEDIDFSKVPSTAEGNIGDVSLNPGDLYAVISVKGYGEMKFKLYYDMAPVGVESFIRLAADGYYSGKNFHRIIAGFMAQGGSMTGDGLSGMPDGYSEFDIETNYNMRHFYGALAYGSAMGKNGCQFYIVNATSYDKIAEDNLTTAISYYQQLADTCRTDEKYKDYATYYDAIVTSYTNILDFTRNMSSDADAKYSTVGGRPDLDGGYTVFGQLLEGGKVLDAISAVEVVDDGNGNVTKPATDVVIDYVYVAIAE